jgi:poly(3-hydroxybutyrate) depolymerase
MKKTLTFLSIFLTNLTFAQTTQTGNISVTSTLQTNNPRTRSFTFRLPSNPLNCNRPLLIALHGDGGNGSGLMSYTGFNAVADANNFIAVYPDAQNTLWGVQWNKYADNAAGFAAIPDPNAADDVQFISDLIDYFYNTYGIDRSKVYVTGHSGGGFMAYHLAIANLTKNKIAGIAPVAASLWGENAFLNTQFGVAAYVQTPVLHVHCPSDGTVAFPTLSSSTWPLSQFSSKNCSNSAYTTTAITPTIDKHTFCGTGNKVILMGLKKAGLGHGWPTLANADYDGPQEIWNFLNAFSKGTYASTTTTLNITSTSPASYIANQQIKASEFITTQAPPNITFNSANSNNLTFQAGKFVTLNPGLEISKGSVLTAKVGGCITNTAATAQTMYVQGRNLYDVLGNLVVPVGLNIPTDYYQFSGTNDQVSQFTQTGANMARIIWFQNGLAGASHTNTDLDQLLTKLTNQRIFSVVALWDGEDGCPQNPNQLNNPNGYVSWFIDPSRVTLLNNHKKHVILNLMNELGFGYGYDPNNTADVAAFTNWRNQYKIAITSIRNAGLHMPIMIDAPLCGGSLSLVNQAAAEIIAHDPDHNIIFSIHTYWAEKNETNQIATSVANNVPIIIGEVANKQVGADDWNTDPVTGYSECYFGIDGTTSEHAAPTGFSYKNLLPNSLIPNNIGYLFWEWTNDACLDRRMSPDGNFSNLTNYGLDAVHNTLYGIHNKAVRSGVGAF